MNRQKLATIGCIALSVLFSLSLGYLLFSKVLLPLSTNVYENLLDYPEDLYVEYEKEAERIINEKDLMCKYYMELNTYCRNNRITLIMKIGDEDRSKIWSNYITATVENFGTNEQKATFKRSIESAQEAYEQAENYRNRIKIINIILGVVLVIFTAHLIISSIKRKYRAVFFPMICIIGVVLEIMLFRYFFTT